MRVKMNAQQYQESLKEINCLFGSKPGTSEFERFQSLLFLVEEYEEENF